MSTAIPAGAPAPASAAAPAKEIARPLLWLLAILVLGLGLRLMHFRGAAFETDEFTALAAVAERQGLEPGTTPTAQDPLVPVPSLGEVSNRSVIPFGIPDPVPLYHYFLWAVIHVLPVADWSVRLPSLLAGVACIAAVFFLVRRPFGTEMALVAALFVALDPIQINTSWLARPFALADLLTVLSFVTLLGVLRARTAAAAVPWALGYALCVALIGYLDALLLFVIAAHVGMVAYAFRSAADDSARKAVAYWAAGLALGVVLLVPEFGYFYRVTSWAVDHARYLTVVNDIHIFTPFVTLVKHNLVLLGGLILVMAAGAVVRMQLQGGSAPEAEGEGGTAAADASGTGGAPAALTQAPPAGTAVAPAPAAAAAPPEPAAPLPESDEGLNMARVWVFLPQTALLLASLLVAAVFVTRNLTYTSIGAAVLLAYYATRDGSREVRLGVSGAVAVGLLLLGFWSSWSAGQGLFSSPKALEIMGTPDIKGGLAGEDMNKIWKPGDVVLMRPALIEADFLRTEVPEASRPQVERALVAPLTLLYPDSSHKPVIPLTLSQYRSEKVKTPAGDQVDLAAFYDAAFTERLKQYDRFWMTGVAPTATPNSWQYLSGIVPWMADHLERGELVLSRQRSDPAERYVTVKPGLGLDEPIKGLTEDRQRGDFDNPLHIVRRPSPSK
jgi:hypothetical protein